MVGNKWCRINTEAYNKYISYEKNRECGMNLPPEGICVVIYDSEEPSYHLGRIWAPHVENESVHITIEDKNYTIELNDHNQNRYYYSEFDYCGE